MDNDEIPEVYQNFQYNTMKRKMEKDETSDNENLEVAPKKMKSEWSKSYSNKAMEMMKKMGYENDKGLGKLNQGRLEPIVPSQQEGRRGLGSMLDARGIAVEGWDPSLEVLNLPEKVTWLQNDSPCDYNYEEMKGWLQFGYRKETINDETRFCEPDILQRVLKSKSFFDELNDVDLRRARSRCNPFETIRSSIFLNRAAVKMANIDSMCDYMFTKPTDMFGSSLIRNNELLYFADICAGPGGFSEYVLYRKKWESKGFGFTLRGVNDFKLDKFFAGPPESFDPHYGVHNNGDIFNRENQDSFKEYVLKHCPAGVHFVMADGGFSVEGQENIQEILSKQLYLCQCLMALKILRENGSFLCKLFDLFTPFSVGLIYLMYQCFAEIAIIKPNSSRPANSERYLVCKWKRSDVTQICEYMDRINDYLNQASDDNDVQEIVNYDIIMEDQVFFDYIFESNNTIGSNQIIGLKKIAAFCQNPQLKETRQTEFRKRCLDLWNLPDTLRQPPEVKSIEKSLEELLGSWYADKSILNSNPIELNSVDLLKSIESIYDWYFVPIGRGETNINQCSIFLCKSRGTLIRYTCNKKWETMEQNFEISPKTLFFGEIVYEYSGEGRTQTRVNGLHIIDAIILGGIDVRRLKLSDRLKMCEKYALSINKPYREGNHATVRSKHLYKLTDFQIFFQQMHHHTLKDGSMRLGFSLKMEDKFFVPGGILLIPGICHFFFSKMSNSRKVLYYFDKNKGESYYMDGMPPDIQNILYASFRNSFPRRLIWKWTNTNQVEEDTTNESSDDTKLLYRNDFQQFINRKLNT